MKRRLTLVFAMLVAALVATLGAAAGNGTPIDPSSANPLTVSVIGDVPYSAAQLAAFPSWVEAINGDPKVDAVVHLGDIKSGSTRCDDSYYATILELFETFKDPVVYTPGDNEWTDCHRANNGQYNPLERLSRIRAAFFPEPGVTLGGRKKQVLAQSGYPEDVLWMQSKAVFAALHVVGSNNSLAPWSGLGFAAPTIEQLAEANARIAATIAWTDEAFETAEAHDARGVVLMMQADTFLGSNESATGFVAILDRIEERAAAFDGPVLLLQGDTHEFAQDTPLPGAPNLTRIVVKGSADTPGDEWLKVTVDPRAPTFFSWERMPF
jgi:Calcineurin-like phosphoesterase